ncbi:MAG: SH3 domain-containing protein [Clostridia bacterium]|nr:SH3 domain-containing protein [Clostridia bacterium]
MRSAFKRCICFLICFMFMTCISAVGAAPDDSFYIVTSDELCLRSSPGTSSSKTEIMKKGDVVRKLDDTKTVRNGYTWIHVISVYSSNTGYAASECMKAVAPSKDYYFYDNEAASASSFYSVSKEGVRLYSSASTSSDVVNTLSKGTVLADMLSRKLRVGSTEWLAVKTYDSGTFGYVLFSSVVSTRVPGNAPDSSASASASSALPSSSSGSSGKQGTYTVTSSKLNVRSSPTVSSSKVRTLAKGDNVERIDTTAVTADGYKWFHVRISGTSAEGYCASEYLRYQEGTAASPSPSSSAAASAGVQSAYTVSANSLNLREKATTSSRSLTLLHKGDKLLRIDNTKAVSQGYTWYHVKSVATGLIGYCASVYLKISSDGLSPSPSASSSAAPASTDYYVVTANKLNIRKKATTSSDSLMLITKGTRLLRLDKTSSTASGYTWFHIRELATGTEGYVASIYISAAASAMPSASPSAAVSSSAVSSPSPTVSPSSLPSASPSASPSVSASPSPSVSPSVSPVPSIDPSKIVAEYRVTSGTLNLRKEPTTSSDKLTTLVRNDTVIRIDDTITDNNGYDWYHVCTADMKTIGYAASYYLAEKIDTVIPDYYVVRASEACLRKTPRKDGEIIEILEKGDMVDIIDSASVSADGYTWSHVRSIASEKEGYIVADFIRKAEAADDPYFTGDYETQVFLTVSADSLYMRKEPKLNSGIIEELAEGDVLLKIESTSYSSDGYTWSHVVSLKSNKEGYVADKFTKSFTYFLPHNAQVYTDPVTGRTYTTYNQGDAAWNFSKYTASTACLISSYAMVLTNGGIYATPKTVYEANNNSTGGNLNTIAAAFKTKTVCAVDKSAQYFKSFSSGRTYIHDPDINAEQAIKDAIDRHPEGVLLFFEKPNGGGHAVVAVKYDDSGIIFCDSGRTHGSMIRWSETWCAYKHKMTYADLVYIMALDI